MLGVRPGWKVLKSTSRAAGTSIGPVARHIYEPISAAANAAYEIKVRYRTCDIVQAAKSIRTLIRAGICTNCVKRLPREAGKEGRQPARRYRTSRSARTCAKLTRPPHHSAAST